MFQCTIHHTLSFPHCVLKSFLYVCVSFAALHVGLLVLSILHVYVLDMILVFLFLIYFILFIINCIMEEGTRREELSLHICAAQEEILSIGYWVHL